LSPCTLTFNVEHFQILNSSKDKLFSNTQFSYQDVHTITMKTNEFFNISFNDTKKTLKLCSAYPQIILNQLYTHAQRDGQHEIIVDFKESTKFEYKDEWIYKIAPDKRISKKIENQEFQNLSSLFAQEETRNNAEEIDKTLDEVSGVLRNITMDGIATNEIIKQQKCKLKNVEEMTDREKIRIS